MSAQPVPSPADLRGDLESLDADSRFVDASDVRLHVLSYRGSGPPVLVLPGITSPAITWDFVARWLRDSAKVHVVDLRGRGLSDHPERGYGHAEYVADTVAVVRDLYLPAPILLGHSLGARIAAACAAAHPDLPRGLILVDPPLSGPGRDPYPTSLAAFLEQLGEAQRGTSADEVRRHYPSWPDAELRLRARWLPTCSTDAVIETHRGFETEDFFPLWRSLRPPTGLVYGADSPVVTAEGVRALEAVNPEATVIRIPGAGHMVPWDSPAPFAAAVLGLLRQFAAQSIYREEIP